MIGIDARRLAVRLTAAASAATAAVCGLSGAALAAPALPTGTITGLGAAGAIAGSYIVVLHPGSPTADDLVREYGGTVEEKYRSTVHGFHLRATERQARRLAADPAVAYVEQDATVTMSAVQRNATWGLDRIDQRALPLSKSYATASAADVTAYVIDSGIRVSHREFGGRAVNGTDLVDRDAVAQDCNGHGTHVAGTIGGATNGVAKNVRLVAVRVVNCAGSGSYADFIAGVDWVTANAKLPAVANMSIGGPVSKALNDAVNRSIARGVTYVVAAGNENKNACQLSPGSTPAAITVGASDSRDTRGSFSNYGSCLDLFAPGVGIQSASKTSDTAVQAMSGTSMAAPHVAGAAALVLGVRPGWTPQQVRDDLVRNAGTNLVRGAGVGSPNKLLHTGYLNATALRATAVAACGPFTDNADVPVGAAGTVTVARTVSGCAGVGPASARLTVNVRQAVRGALTVTLVGPSGRAYPVKAASATDTVTGLATTYAVDLSAESRRGRWSVRIGNSGAAGVLDSWTLRL